MYQIKRRLCWIIKYFAFQIHFCSRLKNFSLYPHKGIRCDGFKSERFHCSLHWSRFWKISTVNTSAAKAVPLNQPLMAPFGYKSIHYLLWINAKENCAFSYKWRRWSYSDKDPWGLLKFTKQICLFKNLLGSLWLLSFMHLKSGLGPFVQEQQLLLLLTTAL